MTHGGHFSRTAKSAINRFYEHADTRHLATLQECVSELYLSTDSKKTDKLWQRVDLALGHLKAEPAKAVKIIETRDLKGLAELTQRLVKN